MKNLKIKFGLFSLLAILAASVFLTSCEQELVNPQKEDNLNIPAIDEYSVMVPDFNSVPAVNSAPEKTSENTASTKLFDRACLQYNSWNYFEQTGWIYVYEYPASWVWSDKYQDFIYMTNQTDICDYGLTFHTNNPICGRTGWIWDNDASDDRMWNWTGSNWVEFSTRICFVG